jgi:hypothetical protein
MERRKQFKSVINDSDSFKDARKLVEPVSITRSEKNPSIKKEMIQFIKDKTGNYFNCHFTYCYYSHLHNLFSKIGPKESKKFLDKYFEVLPNKAQNTLNAIRVYNFNRIAFPPSISENQKKEKLKIIKSLHNLLLEWKPVEKSKTIKNLKWWKTLNRKEQKEYIKQHPGSKFKVSSIR